MSTGYQFILLGMAAFVLTFAGQRWFFPAGWLGLNFIVLGIAQLRGAHGVFGKRGDGTLPWWSRVLFLPLLLFTAAVWHAVRLLSQEDRQNEVTENLVAGRRLLGAEFMGGFDNVVDLTSEFTEPAAIRSSPGYRSFPILDGMAPSPEALAAVVAGLKPGRTFIHCAQGHGRTGLFALAVLISSGAVRSVDEGLDLLRAARPGIRLKPVQIKCIEACAQRFAAGSVADCLRLPVRASTSVI